MRTFNLLTGVLVTLICARSIHAQTASSLLVSRAELTAAAEQAELGTTKGDYGERSRNAMIAAAIRERLRDGDIQVGDRVILTVVTDRPHVDTLVVRAGRVLEIPRMMVVPVGGVLRSELQDRVSTEVLRYVKAQRVEVTPLVRIAVLGAVVRPGYFAFSPELPINDAIMGAGGPAVGADLQRSLVRRGNQQYRSPEETRDALATGLTLDQFGLAAGDQLIVGQRKEFSASTLIGTAGALASVLMLVVAMHRR